MATAICKTPLRLPLKSGIFLSHLCATVKGYVEREISLPSLEKERGTFSWLSKVVVFLALLGAPVRGIYNIGRELLLLRSRERRALIQGSLCSPFWVHW